MVIPMRGQYEQQCNAAALQSIGVDALDSLDLMHYRTINYWINRPVTKDVIDYPDQTEMIVQNVIIDFEKKQIPEAPVLTPVLSNVYCKVQVFALVLLKR